MKYRSSLCSVCAIRYSTFRTETPAGVIWMVTALLNLLSEASRHRAYHVVSVLADCGIKKKKVRVSRVVHRAMT